MAVATLSEEKLPFERVISTLVISNYRKNLYSTFGLNYHNSTENYGYLKNVLNVFFRILKYFGSGSILQKSMLGIPLVTWLYQIVNSFYICLVSENI